VHYDGIIFAVVSLPGQSNTTKEEQGKNNPISRVTEDIVYQQFVF